MVYNTTCFSRLREVLEPSRMKTTYSITSATKASASVEPCSTDIRTEVTRLASEMAARTCCFWSSVGESCSSSSLVRKAVDSFWKADSYSGSCVVKVTLKQQKFMHLRTRKIPSFTHL